MTVDQEVFSGIATIYVVWGPTAEHGDGSGPLAYFTDRETAESFIEEEVKHILEIEEETGQPIGWPYDFVDFVILEKAALELIPEYYDYGFRDLEDVLDYLYFS